VNDFLRITLRTYRLEFLLAGSGALVVAAIAILMRWFTASAEAWPTVSAKIENVFLDTSAELPNQRQRIYIVLAYGYSISDEYYSGQITLWASPSSLEKVQKHLVGRNIAVHYRPKRPNVSIFLGREVGNYDVIADRRISVLSWLS
jgi:hypothetical protein